MDADPSLSLAVGPLSVLLLHSLTVMHYSESMLFTLTPTADVGLATRPIEGALAVLFAVLEVSLISAPVHPGLDSATLHFTKSEFTLVEFIEVCEIVLSKTLELPVHEVSLKEAAIFPFKTASTLLLASKELSHVSRTWFAGFPPRFNALAMLQILEPVAFILGLVVNVNEYAEAVGPVVDPQPLIHVSISVRHPASAVGLPSRPHAFVFGTVWPQLHSEALPLTRLFIPLTFVRLAFPDILEFVDVDTKLLLIILCLTMKAGKLIFDIDLIGRGNIN